MRLRVERFDPNTIKEHRSVLFVGRSGSGKSVAMRAWLRCLAPRFDAACFFSPTQESADEFRRFVPASFVHESGLDLELLDRIIHVQKDALTAQKEKRGTGARSILICADDCTFDKSAWRSPVVRSILMQGRHLHISFWLCSQYCMDIPVDCRSQISYVACTAEPIHANRKRLYASFFGAFKRYDEFDEVLMQCTKDHKLCVLDQTDMSGDLTNVYWYLAALKGPVPKIGKPIYWKLEQQQREKAKRDTALTIAPPAAAEPRRRVLVDAC